MSKIEQPSRALSTSKRSHLKPQLRHSSIVSGLRCGKIGSRFEYKFVSAGCRDRTGQRPVLLCFLLRRRGVLLDESNCYRVAIEFSIARLDGRDDDKNRVQHPKDRQKSEPDQDQAKDCGDDVVDEHRDLEVERFFAVRVDLGRVVPFGQPDNERSEQVPGEMKENAEQRAGVTQNIPVTHV